MEAIAQETLLTQVRPIMKEQGHIYTKFRTTFARKAIAKEYIVTITESGKETENIAEIGDYIIKNNTTAKEAYVLKPANFAKRYRYLEPAAASYAHYQPIGRVVAIEINGELLAALAMPDRTEFSLMASWGEQMSGKKLDFLACPLDFSEVYLIGRVEFFETYRLDGDYADLENADQL